LLESSPAYRKDIDGLRAVAILPVLLHHANIPGFTGGFVGVDIFFVISGYLITRILLNEVNQTGKVSISGFYGRRIRRILPALVAVQIVSMIAAWFLLFPNQLIDFAKSSLSTTAFSSNFWFWSQSGYFRAQDSISPLLHTWSLAVEEQFYIIMPFVIWLGRKHLVLLSVIAAITSFLISVAGVYVSPGATFYLLPTRAWELLIGSLLAMGVIAQPQSQKSAQIQAALGMAMILIAVFLYSKETPFPGHGAILPCLGSALLINAHRAHETPVGRLLSTRFFVVIGLISYSLYLWHWPILVFMRQYLGELTLAASIFGLVLSLIASVVSYRFIEKPARDPRRFRTTAWILTVAIAATVGSALVSLNGLPKRFSDDAVIYAAGEVDRSPIARNCGNDCVIGDGPTRFVLIGDSHAGALSDAFDHWGRETSIGGRLVQMNACPPILGNSGRGRSLAEQEKCSTRNSTVIQSILDDPTIEAVFLSGYWTGDDLDPTETLEAIAASGKRAFLLYEGPESDRQLPLGLARQAAFGADAPVISIPDQFEPDETSSWTNIRIGDAFCTPECAATSNGAPILFDTHHLSAAASRNVLGPFLVALDPLATDQQTSER